MYIYIYNYEYDIRDFKFPVMGTIIRKYDKNTLMSKHVLRIKDKTGESPIMKWNILKKKTQAYKESNNGSRYGS